MLIDISQPVFSCRVWPGDPVPKRETVADMAAGDPCNVTAFSMCAHNGTHVDAPKHFYKDGAGVEAVGLTPFVGDCFVARAAGELGAAEAAEILTRAKAAGAAARLLLAGELTVTEEAAAVFADARLLLLGIEGQSVGPADAPRQAHLILLGAGVCLLEGAVLKNVNEGRYFLSAAPLNLGDADGAPCRAVLIMRDSE